MHNCDRSSNGTQSSLVYKLYKNITRSRLFCRIAKRSIHKKLLRAISPKIGNFARAIKSSRDHVCASADAIVSDRSRKTKRPVPETHPFYPRRPYVVIHNIWKMNVAKMKKQETLGFIG